MCIHRGCIRRAKPPLDLDTGDSNTLLTHLQATANATQSVIMYTIKYRTWACMYGIAFHCSHLYIVIYYIDGSNGRLYMHAGP